MTALQRAVRSGDVGATTEALQDPVTVDEPGDDGLTALMVAAAQGQPLLVKALLAAGASPLLIEQSMGATALHKAAQAGNGEVIELLLEAGAFVDQQSPILGNTALVDAVLHKSVGAVHSLLAHGAKTSIRNHWNQTALELAREDGSDEIVAQLEEHDRRVSEAITELRLAAAAKAGDVDTVRQLIAAGAEVNFRVPASGGFDDSYTPIGLATREGHVNVVAALLNAGANPGMRMGLMWGTAIHEAAFFGRAEVLRLMVAAAHTRAADLDLDAQGPYNGLTALHDAIWHGHEEAARQLLDAGANPSLKTHAGLTPRDLADLYGYDTLVNLLEQSEKE